MNPQEQRSLDNLRAYLQHRRRVTGMGVPLDPKDNNNSEVDSGIVEQYMQKAREMNQQTATPTYNDYARPYENDPLSRLYSGRQYFQQPPLSRDEYDYLNLHDKYSTVAGPQLQKLKLTEARSISGGENAAPEAGSYAHYQFLESDLRRRNMEQTRNSQWQDWAASARADNAQAARNIQPPSGGYSYPTQRRQFVLPPNLQSLAARGFYQTPYAYQNV